MLTSYRRRIFLFVVFCFAIQAHGSLEHYSANDFLAQGNDALSQGENNKAISIYRNGVSFLSGDAASLTTVVSLYTNLGTSLSAEGLDDEAAENYEQALAHYREKIDRLEYVEAQQEVTTIAAQAAFFLGMVYQDLHRPNDAAEAYSLAHSLDPRHWSAAANLGALLHDNMANHAKALQAYNLAYDILTNREEEPTDPPLEPRFILSQLQYRIGLCITHDSTQKCANVDNPGTPIDCQEFAAHAFALAVEYDEDNESAKHMLATVTADATMKRASNTYIKSLFDDYASNFEHSLVQDLGYTGYERLRRGFDQALEQDGKSGLVMFATVVDAGCGTGLVGEQFRNVSQHLTGVDLSQAILDEAVKARPNLYDRVIVGDVTTVFRERQPISLIIAADSYIYFGDLEPLFEAMQVGLETGGYAAFTLEDVDEATEAALEATKPDWRWQLTASGRFAHRKGYVQLTAKKYGLKLIHYEQLVNFRYERGVGVRGHLFVLRQSADHREEL